MTTRFGIAILAAALAAALPLCADLKQVQAEANLEKRSKLALDNAAALLKQAREAYQKGEMDHARGHIDEAVASVEIADQSLVATGKDPRRNPKWFKRAELETRDLIRHIESLEHEFSYSDRPLLEKLKAKTQQVHDDLLTGLMEGKRK